MFFRPIITLNYKLTADLLAFIKILIWLESDPPVTAKIQRLNRLWQGETKKSFELNEGFIQFLSWNIFWNLLDKKGIDVLVEAKERRGGDLNTLFEEHLLVNGGVECVVLVVLYLLIRFQKLELLRVRKG